MVFFTCNNCGESVKKPAVEKHYRMKCRNPIFVSCMDCLKDFREDYVGHTRCITEAEKYSGKDYVAKEPKNSGLKKQESWLEIVRSILTTTEYEVSPAVRGIFQKLQSYDNVPRKKAKFENFVSNSMRVRQVQAEAVWNVLEKALEKLKAARDAEKQKSENKNSIENDIQEKNVENTINGVHTEEEEKTQCKEKKKNKKERLVKPINDNNAEEANQDEPGKTKMEKNEVQIMINDEDSKRVTKKKRKSKKEGHNAETGNAPQATEEVPSGTNEEETSEPVTKKKRKSKMGGSNEENGNAFEAIGEVFSGTHERENSEPIIKKKKKSKEQGRHDESGNTCKAAEEVLLETNEETSEPAIKKKRKSKMEGISETNGSASETSEPVTKKKRKSKKDGHNEENSITEENSLVENKTDNSKPVGENNELENGTREINKIPKANKFKVGHFNWTKVIFKILGKHNDEINLDILKKKSMKKYRAKYQLEDTPWKVEKTFNKKLRKSGLLVDNNIVKINVK